MKTRLRRGINHRARGITKDGRPIFSEAKMRKARFMSVCSGIEAASAAWLPLGCVADSFSEIDPFACALLSEKYTEVPNLGDMTKFHEWPDRTIDILVGGTPCQSFSVAGLRKGLADPRGNLMLTYLAIAARYRPRWLVWENVPGVLSVDEGRAFGTLLGGLAELGYGFAYRILDAQYFGIPQRRRRVFVVGHLGNWRRAAAVLFERQSLSGDTAPRREAGERVTGTISARTEGGGGLGTDFELYGGIVNTITAGYGNRIDSDCTTPLIAHALRADGFDASEDGTGRGTPIVFQSKASASQTPSFDDISPGIDVGKCDGLAINRQMKVRRLTPRECQRLQGFPDDYTLIQYRGKSAKDGPRYRALGNSMAVPVMRWIGERIKAVEAQK